MTKAEFLANVRKLYRVGNASDSHDSPERETWTNPAMAGEACCAQLDKLMHGLVASRVISADECQEFYDTL